MQTMRDQMVARIERLSQGKAFSAKDFLDIASWGTIGKAKFNGLKGQCPSCKSSAFGRRLLTIPQEIRGIVLLLHS
ncbi:MAG: hypothetical protein WCB11_11420 [Terriglobales bacterium]